MDMGRTFINVQRPVQNVDMGAEALFKFCKKFRCNQKERFCWGVFLYFPNLQ